jgi:hypothetical protein
VDDPWVRDCAGGWGFGCVESESVRPEIIGVPGCVLFCYEPDIASRSGFLTDGAM